MNTMAEITVLDYLKEMEKGIHARQDAQASMLDKVVLPKLNSIEAQVKQTNGRVTVVEGKVEHQQNVCLMVQEQKKVAKYAAEKVKEETLELKKENKNTLHWIVGILVTIILALLGSLFI